MSLDVTLMAVRETQVFESNITHNLTKMAAEAGIYHYLWRPEEVGVSTAGQLIAPLERGLRFLQADPDKYRAFDSPNGWGRYEHLVGFVEGYLAACRNNPDATIQVSR